MLKSVHIISQFVVAFFLLFFVNTNLYADVIINVLAVNGSDTAQEKKVEFSLPGELQRDDILDTNGLALDYDLDNAGFYVHGTVQLGPKESKTFKIRIRDKWQMSDEHVNSIIGKIDEAVVNLTDPEKPKSEVNALEAQLKEDLDQIVQLHQSSQTVEQRIDAHRTYASQLKRIEQQALSIDYWQSDPLETVEERIISFNIEIENTSDTIQKAKAKSFLPAEIKPEHLVNREGFEYRFDESKQQPFLFKEEDLEPGQKKKYTVGVKDVWYLPQGHLDYARSQTEQALLELANSKYAETASILGDQIFDGINEIEAIQSQKVAFKEHVSNYRFNKSKFEDVLELLEELEKLLSKYREKLEVSKIKNVMQQIRSLRSLANVSRAIFDKKPKVNAAWKIIGAVMVFLGIITIIYFATWLMRSGREKDVKDVDESDTEEK